MNQLKLDLQQTVALFVGLLLVGFAIAFTELNFPPRSRHCVELECVLPVSHQSHYSWSERPQPFIRIIGLSDREVFSIRQHGRNRQLYSFPSRHSQYGSPGLLESSRAATQAVSRREPPSELASNPLPSDFHPEAYLQDQAQKARDKEIRRGILGERYRKQRQGKRGIERPHCQKISLSRCPCNVLTAGSKSQSYPESSPCAATTRQELRLMIIFPPFISSLAAKSPGCRLTPCGQSSGNS